jgi:hypothetical protein
MRTKTKIIQALTIFLVSISFIIAQTEPLIYYKLNINYQEEKLSISTIEIEFFDKPPLQSEGEQKIQAIDSQERILWEINFTIPNKIIYDSIDPETGEIAGGGEISLNQTKFELYVPYHEDAKKLNLIQDNQEIQKQDISRYSKAESLSEETIAQKSRVYEKSFNYLPVLVILLLILIGLIIWLISQKRK